MGDKHVVPDFFLRALHGAYYIYGPEQTRSFLNVYATASSNQIVNVGGNEEVTICCLGGADAAAARQE
jgi:hypothetical protein